MTICIGTYIYIILLSFDMCTLAKILNIAILSIYWLINQIL